MSEIGEVPKERVASVVGIARRAESRTIGESVIVALADENDRLRAVLGDCKQALEETRMSSPTWDKLEEIAGGLVNVDGILKSKQGIEIDHLRAQLAEAVALLDDVDIENCGDGVCEWDRKRHAFTAKLRGAL